MPDDFSDDLTSVLHPRIVVVLTPSRDGGYTIEIDDRPGCVSEGDTVPEALRNLAEAVEVYDA